MKNNKAKVVTFGCRLNIYESEIIKEHNCGVAISPNDPELFAKTLVSLSENKNKMNLMGNNAKKIAQNKFDRRKLAEKFVNFIESQIVN